MAKKAVGKIFLAWILVFVCAITGKTRLIEGLADNLANKKLSGNIKDRILPSNITISVFLILVSGLILQFSETFYRNARKVFDLFFSIVILTVSAPVIIPLMILIKLDSKGPVIYKQTRVGLNRRKNRKNSWKYEERRQDNKLGTPFTIYKFRTMTTDAEARSGAVWARENDSRVTRVGRVMRKMHLDEFPQFYNVLKGEMSIIGPRPERPEFVKLLNEHLLYYYKRYDIKPGITGLAQVRYHYTSSLTDSKNKVRYDLVYLRNMGFLMDVKIMFATLSAAVFGKGAR